MSLCIIIDYNTIQYSIILPTWLALVIVSPHFRSTQHTQEYQCLTHPSSVKSIQLTEPQEIVVRDPRVICQ